jgi:hypothetical protein
MNRVYDLEYFCLTDDNVLLVKRKGSITQIIPSEFRESDLVPSRDNDGNLLWTNAKITPSVIKKGEDIVRVDSQGGIFYTTVGHKMFLENGNVEASGNLEKGDKLLTINQFCLPEDGSIDTASAYALGAFAAEGTSQKGRSTSGPTSKWRLEYCLHADEEIFSTKILMGIKSLCPYTNPIVKVFPEYTRRVVGIYSKDAVLHFEKIGALGLCQKKRVPSIIFHASKESKFAYIAGLIEGDGTWIKTGVSVKLTSKALIDGLYILLNSLNIRSTITFGNNCNNDDLDNYRLSIFGKDNLSILVNNTESWLFGYKHLQKMKDYMTSDYKHIKYTREYIRNKLLKLYPCSAAEFGQRACCLGTVKRYFGSWNKCLEYHGLTPKPMRWKNYTPIKCRGSKNSVKHSKYTKLNIVNKIEFLKIEQDTLVYDFYVPVYNNFLLNSIVSHNSGNAAAIYIGDIWIDEVSSFSYTTSQDKSPLYGYASQQFDDTAAGHVLVQGQFTINYKEQGYLWLVLRRWFNIGAAQTYFSAKGIRDPLLARKAKILTREKLGASGDGIGGRPIIGSNGTKVSRATVERLLQGRTSRQERYNFYQSLTGHATASPGTGGDKIFEDIVEAFEDQVWKYPGNKQLLEQIRRTDDNIFDGFDMYVTFGNYSNPKANHTAQKIVGVRLLSQGKSIVIDGNPIQEQYSFIARTVV